MDEDEKQALVLELFAQDLQSGLDGAVRDKQQELVRFNENLWDKVSLNAIKAIRLDSDERLNQILAGLISI